MRRIQEEFYKYSDLIENDLISKALIIFTDKLTYNAVIHPDNGVVTHVGNILYKGEVKGTPVKILNKDFIREVGVIYNDPWGYPVYDLLIEMASNIEMFRDKIENTISQLKEEAKKLAEDIKFRDNYCRSKSIKSISYV